MKKATKKRIRLIQLLNLKHRKGFIRKKKGSYKENSIQISSWINDNPQVSLQERNNYAISFPEEFNLSKNINESLNAINAIRKLTRIHNNKHKLKSIDLNPISEISTSASLLLTAEIDKWNDKIGHRLSPRAKEWCPSIRQHLIELGFFDLLNFNYDEFKDDEGTNTLEIVKFIKGSSKDVKKAKFLREEIERVVDGRIKRPSLFQALSEAITNVTHHAYFLV